MEEILLKLILRIDVLLVVGLELFLLFYAILSATEFIEIISLFLFSMIPIIFTYFYYLKLRVGISYFFLWTMLVYSLGFVRLKFWGFFTTTEITSTFLLLTLSLFFLVIFYNFSPRIRNYRIQRILTKLDSAYSSYHFMVLCIILYLVFIAYKITITGGLLGFISASYGERNDPGNSYLFFIGSLIRSALLITTYTNFSKKRFFSSISVLAIIMVISTIEGSTGAIVGLLAPLIVFTLLKLIKRKKVVKLNRFTALALIIFILVIAYAAYVRVNRSGSDSFSSIIYGRTFDALENSIRIIDRYEAGTQLGINTIVYPLLNFIPRKFWSDKPIGLGRRIMFDIYGAPSNTPVSFAPGFLGEIYVDFGYFGIVVFGLLVGLLLKNFDISIVEEINNNRNGSTFFLINLALLSSNIPNSLQGFLLRLVISIFQAVFTLIISSILRKPGLFAAGSFSRFKSQHFTGYSIRDEGGNTY